MTEVSVNHNFTEKKFGEKQVLVTNESTRDWDQYEIVFAGGFIGEVTDFGGIAADESGYINVDPDRVFSTDQVHADDSFTEGNVGVFFDPQDNSGAGEFREETDAAYVAFSAQIILDGSRETPKYLELKPPYQNGDLEVVGE
jgi:hypothetical protein